jgi:hypothetical protein
LQATYLEAIGKCAALGMLVLYPHCWDEIEELKTLSVNMAGNLQDLIYILIASAFDLIKVNSIQLNLVVTF